MFPHLAPPVWSDASLRPGRVAATFVLNRPELKDDPDARAELSKCAAALIGLPDDTGVELNHGRLGAKGGPAAFRAALSRYGVAMPLDEPGDGRAYSRVFDAGDVLPGRDLDQTHDRITEAVEAIVEAGLFPIAIGGGHDLTFPFVRAVARTHGVLVGVYFDAHLDVRTEPGSGMPFRSLLESGLVDGHGLHCVGLNPLVTLHEHAEYFRSRGGRIHPLAPAPEAILSPAGPSFVSLDLDVFDSAHAPGVSAVNPCGLSPREIEPLIRAAGRSPGVRCFDIMELNPEHDVDGRTARLAAHMFLTFLRGLADRPAAGGAPRP